MSRGIIVAFLVLFVLSAFFSGSEIGLMSLPSHKIDSLLKQRKRGAKDLHKIKSNTDRLLISILLGNNLVNVLIASLATKISIDIASSLGSSEGLVIGISTGIITLLLLFFGEILPKSIAVRYADTIGLRVAKFYVILGKILYPIVIAVEWIMRRLQREHVDTQITEEEIESFIDMGNKAGAFEQGEYEKIRNMLDFYDTTAQEIMVPRIRIDALPESITVDDAINKLLVFSHSRIPVYKQNIDNIERVVRLKELLLAKKTGKGNKKLNEIGLTPIMKVPLSRPIDAILEAFKSKRNHIAIVIDEYGGVAGILSLEDVIEEVFGEILDETDKEIAPIKKTKDGIIFQSYVMFEEALEQFELEFFDIGLTEEEFSGETLGYFITSHLQRFPKVGDEIILDVKKDPDDSGPQKLKLTVMKVQKNIIGDIKGEIV